MGCGTILAPLGYSIQWISVANHLYLAIGTGFEKEKSTTTG
jgi:hypothetical protein